MSHVTDRFNMSTSVDVPHNETILSTVVPEYYPDAVMISSITAVGLLPNSAVLLYVFLKRKKLIKHIETRNIRQAITLMTSANVISILGFHQLLIFYFISLQFGLELNFEVCSFLRNFKQLIVSPAFYSCLLVAIERYVLIFYNINLCAWYVFGLYVLFGAPHIVMFISQQMYYTVHLQNICGLTKVSKIKQLEDIINILYVVYPFVAVLLNLRMIIFVFRFKVQCVHVVRNIDREKHVLLGLMLQALLPIVTTTPENTMYFLYVYGVDVSPQAWKIADAIYCSFLTLNPVITVMFVPHFRNMIIKKIASFSRKD